MKVTTEKNALKRSLFIALSAGLLATGCSSTYESTSTQQASEAVAAVAASVDPNAPISEGQKVVMATHSFNVFIGRPLRGGAGKPGLLVPLAAERGKDGHAMNAIQFIGGSTPMQHWDQGKGDDSKNIAKVALLEAGADLDVFTMSPTRVVPEKGIDLFGDFIIEHNPNARIMVQSSWLAFDGKGALPSAGGSGAGGFEPEMRDDVTLEEIDGWLADLKKSGGYLERLRGQLAGIDTRAGKEMTVLVPSDVSVYNLRKQILMGKIPGVSKQTEIFSDSIGHALLPTEHVVAYTWYAAMYRESPVGLKALVDPTDPDSAARELMLQKIAWNSVVGEPKSGVRGEPVALN